MPVPDADSSTGTATRDRSAPLPPERFELLVESAEEIRARRTGVKWHTYDEDVLPLWVAEMDVRPVPAVVEAVERAVREGDTGYYRRAPELPRALTRFARDRWDWEPDPLRMAAACDVMTAVAELLREVTDPGGPVVVSRPVYDAFPLFIDSVSRELVDAPLGADGRLDLDAIDRVFGEVTAGGARAAYVLCSPHNPTGVVHTAEELGALSRLAGRHGVTVIADEIHAPLVQPGVAFTPYAVADATGRGLSVLSASKGFNLAALKAALVVPGHAWDRAPLHDAVTHGASHLAMIAQTAALDEGRDWLDQLLREVDAQARHLDDRLREEAPETGYRVPEATYLAWLDLRAWPELGDNPGMALLRRGRVAFGMGSRYGGPGHVRVNLATSRAVLDEALDRAFGVMRGERPEP